MKKSKLILKFCNDSKYNVVAIGFIKNIATILNMDGLCRNSMVLITEEICAFLARQKQNFDIELICSDNLYCVCLSFRLSKTALPLSAFNLMEYTKLDSRDLDELGLFLAGRMADHMELIKLPGGILELNFTVLRQYLDENKKLTTDHLTPPFHISEDKNSIKEFSAHVSNAEGEWKSYLTKPGMLIDMISSGDYGYIAALDSNEALAGGIVFSKNKPGIALVDGPFVFEKNENIANMLIEATICRLARAYNIKSMILAPPLDIEFNHNDVDAIPGGLFYRQMHEDTGSKIFVHKSVLRFVSDVCGSIALPRLIQDVKYTNERLPGKTAIFTDLSTSGKKATMHLLCMGQDFHDTLSSQLALLKRKNVSQIYFELELTKPDHSMISNILLENLFVPYSYIPWGSTSGDIMIFRYSLGVNAQ